MTALLSAYVNPLMEENVDCLVLGCTHYPYLIPQIRKLVGNKIQIIDSGQAVARQTKNILEKHLLINTNREKGIHQFFINKEKNVLEMLVSDKSNTRVVTEKDF